MTEPDERDLRSAFAELQAPPSTANYAERARAQSAPAGRGLPLTHRWRMALTSVAAVAAAAVVFAGGYAVLHLHPGGAAGSLSTTSGGIGAERGTSLRPNAAAGVGPLGSTSATISRAQAIADGRGSGATNITDIEARLTTWGDYERINSGNDGQFGARASGTASAESPTALVWVVAVHGRFVPSGSSATFDWVVIAIDAATGNSLTVWAGPQAWPPAGFLSIGDLGGP